MANTYTPTIDGEPVSSWQYRMWEEQQARIAAEHQAWSYTYPSGGSIVKQTTTTKNSGSTYSVDDELKLVPKPSTAYSIQSALFFSGTAIQSGVTIGLSGTSVASGAAYTVMFARAYAWSGSSPTYYSGNPIVIDGVAGYPKLSVEIYGLIESTSDILAWGDQGNPPYVGLWWKTNVVATQSAQGSLMRGSSLGFQR